MEPNTEANQLNDSPNSPPTPEFNHYKISEASNELDFVIPDVCEDKQNTVESTASVHDLTVSPKTSLNESFEVEEEDPDNVLIS